MGLRFRKSVTICKGVRLNFGKTGVSISAGVPGFRKTIHSSGKVTTSIGIPGTGIYYVDTKNVSKKKDTPRGGNLFSDPIGGKQSKVVTASNNGSDSKKNTSMLMEEKTSKPLYPIYGEANNLQETRNIPLSKSIVPETDRAEVVDAKNTECRPDTPVSVFCEPTTVSAVWTTIPTVEGAAEEITYDTIKAIFENCDVAVDWLDVISHKIPTSDEFVLDTWEYLHRKAVEVFDGNIDTYLEIISTVNPYDDLLDYAENFEFSTDDPAMMEINCSLIGGKVNRQDSAIYDDYCAAISIRIARDTFALLPVEKVSVCLLCDGEMTSSAFMRESFNNVNFVGKDASDMLNLIRI